MPEYPAFDESATAGNVTVHATAAEGVLPRDSKLVVKRITRKAILNAVKETVSEKNKEVDSAVALDVIIVNKDGIEIQPNGVVNISFENAAISGNEVNIYHVSDDASTVTEVATNAQSFDANHFSIYVITGEKEKPLTTFNFVDAKGQIVSTQIVKTGDELITPTAPDVAGKAFVGWYDGETKFEDFNTALTITETTTREITAKYEDALYVYFYNSAGTQIMRTEKVSDHDAHDFTNISYEVDATHKIVGWAAKKNGTTNIADKMIRKRYIACLFALGLTSSMMAQNLEQAKKLFLEGEFEKAKPVFQSLVKKAPSNANYNYWYGACCYETGEKVEAQPYLEKSAARKVIDAFKYLGKLYYDMYRFEDAVDNYEQHIEWLEKKKRPTEAAESELEIIKQGARMIKGVEDVAVIDSFVVDKNEFLKAYKVSRESGTLHQDNSIAGTIYQSEMGNKIIYGDQNPDGKMQLYSRIKLINNWSDPEPLNTLNEQGNVNYPYLMADGVTLYYASDGEGSLGGYDIFVTRYDSESSSYLRPDNIGMPFNSPANDYMYVIDELNNLGWFASDRYQPEDKVCIYVFVPNETKIVYDYENTDPTTLKEAASLRSIRTTWKDTDKVRIAKQKLAALIYAKDTEKKEGDFLFIIDDSTVYHTLNDFRSTPARAAYQQVMQKQKDYDMLSKNLEEKREQYAQSNRSQKKALAPGILDLEKRTEQLLKEIEKLTLNVRNEEIKKLKH